MRHIIALLIENEPGALSRVVALFSARGYNIESLTVAPTEDASLSRMTIVTTGSDDVIEQITKHLNRLIEVVKVVDLTEGSYTERELMLIKVRAVGKEREEMKRTADIFRGRIIDVTEKTYTVELTGDASKLTPSSTPSTAPPSWRPCAPAPAASAVASAFCASDLSPWRRASMACRRPAGHEPAGQRAWLGVAPARGSQVQGARTLIAKFFWRPT